MFPGTISSNKECTETNGWKSHPQRMRWSVGSERICLALFPYYQLAFTSERWVFGHQLRKNLICHSVSILFWRLLTNENHICWAVGSPAYLFVAEEKKNALTSKCRFCVDNCNWIQDIAYPPVTVVRTSLSTASFWAEGYQKQWNTIGIDRASTPD